MYLCDKIYLTHIFAASLSFLTYPFFFFTYKEVQRLPKDPQRFTLFNRFSTSSRERRLFFVSLSMTTGCCRKAETC